jgi:hypothetical protein
VRSNLCYTDGNVEQDRNFDSDGHRAGYSAGKSYRAIVRPLQRADTTSVQAGLLRQQNVLRNFKRAQIDSIAAADERRFQLQSKRDTCRVACRSTESGIRRPTNPSIQRQA